MTVAAPLSLSTHRRRGCVDGKRKQLRKRYATEKEARAALDSVRGDVSKGTYVHHSRITLDEACENWLAASTDSNPRRCTDIG